VNERIKESVLRKGNLTRPEWGEGQNVEGKREKGVGMSKTRPFKRTLLNCRDGWIRGGT